MNLPNKLTILRMIMIPFFLVALMVPGIPGGKWIALALFCLASLTDMLDGKIARKYNLITDFGKFMDPLADKLLVCSAMIALIDLDRIPAWVVIVIIAREFIISGFRLVASDNGIVIAAGQTSGSIEVAGNKKISLKIMTLNNSRQKINDCLGNPVEIGIAVIWRVTDTAKAVFNVDNYKEYLSLQCDSALRNVVRVYPYDVAPNVDTTGDGVADEGSLRGSSEVVAARIRDEIQKNVEQAGIEVVEARITYLAYAPEIAAVMLQRQQASAIIDARKMIVDGAVGMVKMALDRLNENKVVELDDERKAAMVSNLLVVLCGNRDAQPIVNSGSLY